MIPRFRSLLLPAAFAALLVPSAHADFLYEFHFDELTFNGVTYSAADLTFTSTVLAQNPLDEIQYESGVLNGCVPSDGVFGTIAGVPEFAGECRSEGTGSPGDVTGFLFLFSPYNGVGTYNTQLARRDITIPNGFVIVAAEGSLTITAVPEPQSLMLMAAGLGLIGFRTYQRSEGKRVAN
jgi:hypothetical protein